MISSLLGGAGGSPLPMVVLIPLILLAIGALFLGGKIFAPIGKMLRFVIALLPALLLWIVGCVAILFWRPVTVATTFILRFIPLDRFISALLEIPARFSRNPLVQGKREQVARMTWPEHIYPDLYREVPDDVIRPPYEDGMLIGGVPLTHLADRHLTDEAYRSSIRAGFVAGLLFFMLVVALLVLKTLGDLVGLVPILFGGKQPILEQWPGAEPVRVSIWSVIGENAVHALANLFGNLLKLLVYLPAGLLMATGTAIIISLLLVGSWMRRHAIPYEFLTKDAVVRWPYRIEARRIIQETYRRQVRHATERLAGAKTFQVGTATGTLRARGDLSAPFASQPVKLDEESLFQHTLVFGGTGEGKTSAILKPMMRAVLADRKFGAFIMDAKGVLWRDALKVAQSLGRQDDVVMIGTDDDSSGVNLTSGLDPTQIASVLRSVSKQAGSASADSFWPEMASAVLRHMLTIGTAYAGTTKGQADKSGPGSIWWAYQAVLDNKKVDEAISALRADYEIVKGQLTEAVKAGNRSEAERLKPVFEKLGAADLQASIEYSERAWREMAEETRTGIIANATSLLDGFSNAHTLRERFISGETAKAVLPDLALQGKIVLVNLSAIEGGMPARLVMILLKTALYRASRQRETRFRATGQSVMENPCLVVMDEVQELATVDPASGLSDATFWNVARSTGMAGLFATQTVSALTQAMGKDSADNFVQQARSKVFFRSEEMETVKFACWCAGEFERNRVYLDGQRESIEYRELIDNWTPFAPIHESAGVQPGPRAFFGAASALLFPERAELREAVARPAYEPDLRFMPNSNVKDGTDLNHAAIMGARSAAHWRAEDKEREYRATGNDIRPALTSSDFMHMGRWHAFAQIQRAGAVRQDIITVEHDFD